jgi:hypothetical protein
MARDGIRPPIVGLQTAAVTLANGNTAIVMRIHKSWNPPHQVTYQRPFDSMDELDRPQRLHTSEPAVSVCGRQGRRRPGAAQLFRLRQ